MPPACVLSASDREPTLPSDPADGLPPPTSELHAPTPAPSQDSATRILALLIVFIIVCSSIRSFGLRTRYGAPPGSQRKPSSSTVESAVSSPESWMKKRTVTVLPGVTETALVAH